MSVRAFLITPFSAARADNEDPGIFESVQTAIKSAAAAANIDLIHPAEMVEGGEIMHQVEREIGRADFVIAILTGLNPNVMLEVGLAKNKPTILIIDFADKLPFDLRHRRNVVYGGSGELTSFPHRLVDAMRETAAAAMRARFDNLSLRRIFDGLLAEHSTHFAGRDMELALLRTACDDSAKPYVLLTAPEGFGKTALLAAFVATNPEICAYHFFASSAVPESLAEDNFLRNVVQQMGYQHNDTAEPPRLLPELRARFHSILSMALECPAVLVLDGIDEISSWQLHNYLPRQPASGLHIVLTARDDGRDWVELLGLDAQITTRSWLHGLSPESVKAVFRAAGGSAEALSADPPMIDKIVEVTRSPLDPLGRADPLYVHFLAEDASAGKLNSGNIGNVPRGLNAYFDQRWKEIRAITRDDAPMQDLFGTLAVAIGLIGRADLEAVNPSLTHAWATDLFDQVIERSRRFIAGDPESGYRLTHPRLRGLLQARIRIPQYLDKLMSFCSRWPETSSPYALRYFASHLQEQKRAADLIELGKQKQFFQKIHEVLPFELDLPLRTSELALRAAIAANETANISELVMVQARESMAISRLASPLDLAGDGHIGTAWRVMDVMDVYLGTLWGLLVSWELHERGQTNHARDTLIRLSRMPLPSLRGWDSEDFVPLLVQAALIDPDSFLQLLSALIPEEYRFRVHVLERLAALGHWQTALRAAHENHHEGARLYSFETILELTPDDCASVSTAVKDAAASLRDARMQANAVARAGQRAGHIEGPNAAAPYFAHARALLAESYADNEVPISDRARVALCELRAGLTPNHADVEDLVTYAPAFGASSRVKIAGMLAEFGHGDRAFELLDGMDADQHDEALAGIAAACARRGDLSSGATALAGINNPFTRWNAFAASFKLGETGDLKTGPTWFEEAFRFSVEVHGGRTTAVRLVGAPYLRRKPELAAKILGQVESAIPPSGIPDSWLSMILAYLRLAAGFCENAVEALVQAIEVAVQPVLQVQVAVADGQSVVQSMHVPQEPDRELLSMDLTPELCRCALGCERPDMAVYLAECLREKRDAWWNDGFFDAALDLDREFPEMAAILADGGEFDHATTIAEFVRWRTRARAFSAVAARQVSRNPREARATYALALRTYQSFVRGADAASANEALADVEVDIVEDARKRGDERSLAMARRISDVERRVYHIAQEAKRRSSDASPAARGLIEEAAAIARAVPDAWDDPSNDEPPWRAAGTAALTALPNPVAPGPNLAAVAVAAANSGFADKARELLSEAVSVTEERASGRRKEAILGLIAHQVESCPGLVDFLGSVIPVSGSGPEKDENEEEEAAPAFPAIEERAADLIRRGEFEAAATLASELDDDQDRDSWIWEPMAKGQAERREFANARATIARLSTAFGKAELLAAVAADAGREKALDEAREMADEAEALFQNEAPHDHEKRDRFLTELAVAWAAAHDLPRAMATANKILDPSDAAHARINIGCELAQAGMGAEAVELAQRVSLHPEFAAFRVARELVQAGDRSHFRELLTACSFRRTTAYLACGLLARVDPANAEKVFSLVEEYARDTE
jgi:hypothetical protein